MRLPTNILRISQVEIDLLDNSQNSSKEMPEYFQLFYLVALFYL